MCTLGNKQPSSPKTTALWTDTHSKSPSVKGALHGGASSVGTIVTSVVILLVSKWYMLKSISCMNSLCQPLLVCVISSHLASPSTRSAKEEEEEDDNLNHNHTDLLWAQSSLAYGTELPLGEKKASRDNRLGSC